MRKLYIICFLLTAVITAACSHPQTSRGFHTPGSGAASPDSAEPPPAPKPLSEEELKTRINQLLNELASEEYDTREEAISKLRNAVKDIPEVIDILLKELEATADPEVEHKLEAILEPFIKWALTGALLRQFPDIIEKIESQDRKVRKQAATELGSKKLAGAAGPLGELLKDRDYHVRAFAIEALRQIGKPAIKPLIKALKDNDQSIPRSAVKALEEIGKAAVEPLIEALNDKKKRVRYWAALALGKIGDKKAVKPLTMLWKEDEDQKVQLGAASGLVKITGDEEAFEFLIAALKDKKWYSRYDAAMALGEAEYARAVEPLISSLKDKHKYVPSAAAKALGKIGHKRAVKPLLEVLKHDNRVVRRNTAWALGKIGDKRAVVPLIEALKDGSPSAAEALGKLGDKRAVEPLIEAMKNDENVNVRRRAAGALGKIGDKRAVEPLIETLKDVDAVVRMCAARALGKIGDKRAVKPLIGRLKDTSGEVRTSAAKALREITKQNFGSDYAKWQQWYEKNK